MSDYLKNIDGVDFYAIIGFFIFFIFFVLVTVHTFRMDKNKLKEFSKLPLEEGETNNV